MVDIVTKLDLVDLRAANASTQAALLQRALSSSTATDLTQSLLNTVAERCISPAVLAIWLTVARNPEVTVTLIRSPHGAAAHGAAIKCLSRHFRKAATFKQTWDALGGAVGIANILSCLSVRHATRLCTALGSIARKGQSVLREDREQRIVELLDLLDDPNRNPDTRMLHLLYCRMAPAATVDVALIWADKISEKDQDGHRSYDFAHEKLRRRLRESHWDAFEQKVLKTPVDKNFTYSHLWDLEPFVERGSLAFGIALLEKVISRDEENVLLTGVWLLREVAEKLAKRCRRRRGRRSRPTYEVHARLWKLIVRAMQKDSEARRQMNGSIFSFDDNTSLVHSAAKFWNYSAHEPQSDKILASCIRMLDSDVMERLSIYQLTMSVSQSLRYRFLRIFYIHHPSHGYDIGHPSTKGSKALRRASVDLSLLTLLSNRQATVLFERLLTAHSNLMFPIPSAWCDENTILSQSSVTGLSFADTHIFRALLLRCADTESLILPERPKAILENIRASELDSRRKKAAQDPDPSTRAFWAVSALRLGVAIGDLDLYADIVVWSRRFNKDVLILDEIYHQEAVLAKEIIDLLCVLPEMKGIHISNVSNGIEKANKVILLYLETAVQALQEPSFKKSTWQFVLQLARQVVERRLERLDALQDQLEMADEDLFQNVLQPTLDLLLRAERLLLKYDHLGDNYLGGLIGETCMELDETTRRPALKFWDTLAEKRNELWNEHRSRLNPAVIELPQPWPRGLPVQALLPSNWGKYTGSMGYIQQRVEAVIFCQPDTANSTIPDDEQLSGIDSCVDSWPVALEIYISSAENEAVRKERTIRAWKHATGSLSLGRMSSDEAVRFWASIFQDCGALDDIDEPKTCYRQLSEMPKANGFDHPVEWNPDPDYPARQRDRRLPSVTCLDCMFPVRSSAVGYNPDGVLSVTEWAIPGPSPHDFWDPFRKGCQDLAGSSIDALLACAILSLNSACGADTSILMKPWPSVDQPRFPGLYLEEQFLERASHDSGGPLEILRRFSTHIPLELVEILAKSILKRMNEETDPSQRHYLEFCSIVKLLWHSNEPSLAVPLVQDFLTDHADASAWHRNLLSKGLLISLQPMKVELFFATLVDDTIKRLNQQRQRRLETPGSSDALSSIPLIKVSTVKLVAQLLQDKSLIEPTRSINLLIQLAQHAEHLDVKMAALETLISSLNEKSFKQHILKFLHSFIVPLAGALNERHPETEAEWEAAENDGSLPEVPAGEHSNWPVMDLLISNADRHSELLDMAHDALRLLSKNKTRWTKLFLDKYNFTLSEDILSSGPAYKLAVPSLLKSIPLSKVTSEWFEEMRRYVMFLLDPPKQLKAITRAVKESSILATSSDGAHWLDIWDNEGTDPLYFGVFWAVTTLKKTARQEEEVDGEDEEVGGGEGGDNLAAEISSDNLEDFIVEVAKAYIKRGAVDDLKVLLGKLKPTYDRQKSAVAENKGHGLVLRRVIDHIESLRTPAWQADPRRQPPVLPQTFALRLKLGLPSPWGKPEYLDSFASQTITLLQSLTGSNAPYLDQYDLLTKHCKDEVQDRIRLAVMLGSPSQLQNPINPSVVDHLRIRLAGILVKWQREYQGSLLEREDETLDLVHAWKDSVVEEWRILGRECEECVWPEAIGHEGSDEAEEE
ncbi:hypothetical protein V8C42DRAFT_80157 [Trichoderma barbatum]